MRQMVEIMIRGARSSVPGKVILLGEHFVVKGVPAIAMAINLRARAHVYLDDRVESRCIRVDSSGLGNTTVCEDKEPEPGLGAYVAIAREAGIRGGVTVRIESDIPPEAGLGSSAATSSSVAAASLYLMEGRPPRPEKVLELAMVGERLFHGKPSGLDVVVGLEGGIVVFRGLKKYQKLRVPRSFYDEAAFIIANTKVPRRTKEAVMSVLQRFERRRKTMESLYRTAGVLVEEALSELEAGRLEAVGELMDIAHGLLSAIGVSFPEAESVIYEARRRGALGAKITGAGLGGGVLLLARKEKVQELVAALRESPLVDKLIVLNIEERGIEYEDAASMNNGKEG